MSLSEAFPHLIAASVFGHSLPEVPPPLLPVSLLSSHFEKKMAVLFFKLTSPPPFSHRHQIPKYLITVPEALVYNNSTKGQADDAKPTLHFSLSFSLGW